MNHILLFLLLILLIPFDLSSAQNYETAVLPITKDTKSSLFTIPLEYRWGGGISPKYTESYLIDLDGANIWRHCPSPRFEYGCAAPECNTARSFLSPICPPTVLNPGDKNCKCKTTAVNPIDGECDLASLSSYNVIIPQTNGRNIVNSHMFRLYVSCSSFTSMGVAGFSRAPFSLPKQVIKIEKFALCLPNTDKAKGVVFFGNGPYYLNHSRSNLDLSKILYYTPLLKLPNSPEYFIGLNGISINGRIGNYRKNAFDLDSRGNGGVKISTVVPYTKLRSDIYKIFVSDFSKALSGISRVKKVGRFEFCVDINKLKKEKLGFRVPTISLELANGETWPIFGANSMKEVGNNVACLAFVDGTKRAEHAVVIGSYPIGEQFIGL